MLFGGRSDAAPVGGSGSGGIGLMDIILIGAAIYFVMKYLKRRRRQQMAEAGYPTTTYQPEGPVSYREPSPAPGPSAGMGEVERGFQQIRQFDPSFSEEELKETFQDLFFRIQAGWMHRSFEGIDDLLSSEMKDIFSSEFNRMKQQGRINRLENIAVRKVEPSEVWQEMGKDYVTVLFTANLLDYVVDEKSGEVIEGDRLSPVKFQEFWTFCRDVGTRQWILAGINQAQQ
jgi:predicted lipid-binding transport protein (Tim44 family)